MDDVASDCIVKKYLSRFQVLAAAGKGLSNEAMRHVVWASPNPSKALKKDLIPETGKSWARTQILLGLGFKEGSSMPKPTDGDKEAAIKWRKENKVPTRDQILMHFGRTKRDDLPKAEKKALWFLCDAYNGESGLSSDMEHPAASVAEERGELVGSGSVEPVSNEGWNSTLMSNQYLLLGLRRNHFFDFKPAEQDKIHLESELCVAWEVFAKSQRIEPIGLLDINLAQDKLVFQFLGAQTSTSDRAHLGLITINAAELFATDFGDQAPWMLKSIKDNIQISLDPLPSDADLLNGLRNILGPAFEMQFDGLEQKITGTLPVEVLISNVVAAIADLNSSFKESDIQSSVRIWQDLRFAQIVKMFQTHQHHLDFAKMLCVQPIVKVTSNGANRQNMVTVVLPEAKQNYQESPDSHAVIASVFGKLLATQTCSLSLPKDLCCHDLMQQAQDSRPQSVLKARSGQGPRLLSDTEDQPCKDVFKLAAQVLCMTKTFGGGVEIKDFLDETRHTITYENVTRALQAMAQRAATVPTAVDGSRSMPAGLFKYLPAFLFVGLSMSVLSVCLPVSLSVCHAYNSVFLATNAFARTLIRMT